MILLTTKIAKLGLNRGKASVHITFGNGSMTISNILIEKIGDKVKIKMPLSGKHTDLHPCVTLQGDLKGQVLAAIEEAYWKADG